MNRNNAKKYFGPVKEKGFTQALDKFLSEEFPQLGGPKTRRLLAEEIKNICDKYYVRAEMLKPGQIRWPCVEKHAKAAEGRLMRNTPQVVATLTVISEEDINKRVNSVNVKEIRKNVIKRITEEAWDQGGVLASNDIAALLHLNHSSVTQMIREYEKEHPGEIVRRRGNMHDQGPTLSHKEQIIDDYVNKKFSPEIAYKHNHNLKSVDRYITNFEKVKEGVKKGLLHTEISHITGIAPTQVWEYAKLVERYYPELVKNVARHKNIKINNAVGDISHLLC